MDCRNVTDFDALFCTEIRLQLSQHARWYLVINCNPNMIGKQRGRSGSSFKENKFLYQNKGYVGLYWVGKPCVIKLAASGFGADPSRWSATATHGVILSFHRRNHIRKKNKQRTYFILNDALGSHATLNRVFRCDSLKQKKSIDLTILFFKRYLT